MLQVVHTRLSRAIWLVDSRDLNPHGIDIAPMLSAIKNRYDFQVFPSKPGDANEHDPNGIVFMNGSFALDGRPRSTIVKATIHSDGLVVDSAVSTDFGEAFLGDALGFLAGQFGLTFKPEMINNRLFVSELIVTTDKSIVKALSVLKPVWEKFSAIIGRPFQPSGFRFHVDPAAGGPTSIGFVFEREASKPFAKNRYFTSAPLRTQDHIALLEEMDALL
jgi:hypothetical protein